MTMRRVLHEIRLDKIAAVDRPCQEPALATIMKRAAPGAEGEATMSIKKSLGLADTATDAEVQAAIEKQAADLATAQAASAELAKVAALTGDERAHYDGLEKAAKGSGKAFLDKTPAERQAMIDDVKKGDESFTTADGAVISKRAVGDAAFSVMKSQEARLQAQDADLKKAAEATAMAGFTKRATEEFPHLAGSTEERAAVLKHLSTAPEDVRKAADAMLKAAEGAAKFAFEKAGHGGGKGPERLDAEAELKKKADDLVKADTTGKLTFAKAYDDVLATPEGQELYEKSLSKPVQE